MLFYETRPNDFSINNNKGDVAFDAHFHRDIEILCMRSGIQRLTLDGKYYEVKRGEIAVTLPNVVHEWHRENGIEKEADELLIICSPNFYRSFFPSLAGYSLENPVIPADVLPGDAIYSIENLRGQNPQNVQIGLSLILIERILEHIDIKQGKKASAKDITRDIIEYVNANFTQPLTLETISKKFYISRNYVSKIFSEKIKMNFKRYLGVLRAEYAAQLMRTSDSNLTLIAENAGFESIRTFNRVFQAIYGLPPREFRRNISTFIGEKE